MERKLDDLLESVLMLSLALTIGLTAVVSFVSPVPALTGSHTVAESSHKVVG